MARYHPRTRPTDWEGIFKVGLGFLAAVVIIGGIIWFNVNYHCVREVVGICYNHHTTHDSQGRITRSWTTPYTCKSCEEWAHR